MDSEGMEALLDFPEFGLDAPQSEQVPPLSVEGETVPSADGQPAEPASGSEEGPSSASEENATQDATQTKKKKRHHEETSDGEPPHKQNIITSESDARERRRDAGEEPGPSREAGDDEHGEREFPSEQDFESDFLDLMPFKEEDPEDVAERQKLQLLISHLSEEQLNRYEVYRRASFPKASVRRIMQTVSGTTVSQNTVIAMAGIAKMHVGEIVEQALDVKEAWGDVGPVQPKHLREALRKLRNRATVCSTKFRKNIHDPPYP